jgi:hypothetical protein
MKLLLFAMLLISSISNSFANCDLTLRIQGINDDGNPMFELNIKDIVKLTQKLTKKGYNVVEVKAIFDRSKDQGDYTATFSTNGLGGILSNSNVYMDNQNDETIINKSKTAILRDGLMYRGLAKKIPSCKEISNQ